MYHRIAADNYLRLLNIVCQQSWYDISEGRTCITYGYFSMSRTLWRRLEYFSHRSLSDETPSGSKISLSLFTNISETGTQTGLFFSTDLPATIKVSLFTSSIPDLLELCISSSSSLSLLALSSTSRTSAGGPSGCSRLNKISIGRWRYLTWIGLP